VQHQLKGSIVFANRNGADICMDFPVIDQVK